MRSRQSVVLVVLLALTSVLGVYADDDSVAVTTRIGIPGDVLFNLAELYTYGLGLEVGVAVQATPRFIVGGVAGYGYGSGKSIAVPDVQNYVWAAARFGIGSISGLSVSGIGGIVYRPNAYNPPALVPDLGITVDWRYLSLGLTLALPSVGATITF